MDSIYDDVLLNISSRENCRSDCMVVVNKETVCFCGEIYTYIHGDFRKFKEDIKCDIKDFLGMGYLKKRSRIRLIYFFVCGCLLGIVDSISDKLSDYLFWVNIDWISYIVNILLILSIFLLGCYWFSKKSVIEFSFLNKRICVEVEAFTKEDFNLINEKIIEQQKRINIR